MKLFCSNYWQKPPATAAVHYFQCNSHHYYHFHYHCKMHSYYLKILLSIPLCNMISCLLQLNFIFFLLHIFFSSLIPNFSFLTPSKRTHNSFMIIGHILDVLFIRIFISIVIYTVYTSSFTLTCLYFFTLTYLYLCFL